MKILLVEFDSGDGVEAEAFLTKQSLIDWYHEIISGGVDCTKTFDNLVNSETHEFTVDNYDYRVYYSYEAY